MADVEDVGLDLATFVNLVLYPNNAGTSGASPVAGLVVRTVNGWPLKQELDGYIKAAAAMVSVSPSGSARNTTIGTEDWQTHQLGAATYTLNKVGQTVLVGGAAPDPYRRQNLVIFAGGLPYLYSALAGDSAATIAAALAALIPGGSADVAEVAIPDTLEIGALRVGVTGEARREVGRQDQTFQVVVWAPSPEARRAIVGPIDSALRALGRLPLAEGGVGTLRYRGTNVIDTDQLEGIFRRDLLYSVEYGTVQAETQTQIIVIQQSAEDQNDQPLATRFT